MHKFNKAGLAALAAAIGLACASASGAATPSSAPDWSGVWTHVGSINYDPTITGGKTDEPPYNAKYQKRWEEIAAAEKEGRAINDKSANCEPPGIVRFMNLAYPTEILSTPGQLTIYNEWAGVPRRIYTDGRGHPEGFDPSYNGHSIGHWEGATLIVDTVGILGDGILNDHGAPVGEKVHVTEKWYATDPETLKIEFTLESDAFTRPYSATKTLKKRKGMEILEYVCVQNNRNPTNADGTTTVTLAK